MPLVIILLLSLILASDVATPGQTRPVLGPGRKYTSVERMNLERLGAVHRDRLRYSRERRPVRIVAGYTDYRAVLHAHAEDAAHTGGTRLELLEAAKRAGVRIVMLTDHVRPERDFIDDSWRGLRDGVLFIPGAESEGFLAYPISSIRGRKWGSRDEYARLVKQGGGDIFLSHVEEKLDWPTEELGGLEIYNHHTDVKDETEFMQWLRGALTNPARLRQIEQALAEYPLEVLGAQQDYLSEIMAKWDRDAQRKRLTGVAANDCHHNQVFTVTMAGGNAIELGYITSRPTTTRVTVDQAAGVAELINGRKPGEVIARLDFDPYERSLRYVTTHILATELTEAAVRTALKLGRAYVAHDWLCDPTGFAFVARDAGLRGRASQGRGKGRPLAEMERQAGSLLPMGAEPSLGAGLKLTAVTPVTCTLKLIRNGEPIVAAKANQLTFDVKSAGVYRIEAWLELDGEERPWIYSNPIYVR